MPRVPGAWIILIALVVRLGVAAVVPLYPDEAYYWEWSRRLAAGYFDHPPLIALFIRAGTILLGPTPLGVRLLPVFCGAATAWAAMLTARLMAGRVAGDVAALTFSVLPILSGAFVLATPDAPLLAFLALAAWCVTRALLESDSRSSLGWWLGAGVLTGAALASKYTAVLLPLGVLAALIATPALRAELRKPGPWLAVVAATLVFYPVIRWNAQHDWTSFRFQLAHGLGGGTFQQIWTRELELLGGQALMLSPILFVLAIVAVARAIRGEAVSRAWATAAVVTGLVFVWSASRNRVEANWPAPAWIPAVLVLTVAPLGIRAEKWRRAGTGLALTMSIALYVQSIVPIVQVRPDRDPTSQGYGWDDLAAGVGMFEGDRSTPTWIAANRYQDAAELALLLPGQPQVFSLNLQVRSNQYRFWPRFSDRAKPGDDMVLVRTQLADSVDDPVVEALRPAFESVVRGPLVPMRRGSQVVAERRLWRLRGWTGAPAVFSQ